MNAVTEWRHYDVPVSDGAIHVAESGPADAEAIVFLHGWPEDWSAWTGVIELARGEYRCLAIDLPGIGQSSLQKPRGDSAYLAGVS